MIVVIIAALSEEPHNLALCIVERFEQNLQSRPTVLPLQRFARATHDSRHPTQRLSYLVPG
ncbi:MAG: hypothetical protein WD176_02510, partial [Pirellulales bacterium]